MNFFEKRFKQLLDEDMTAGTGGVFGDAPSMGHGGAVGNTDFYATGDMRIPTGGKKKKKRTNKNKKQNKRRGERKKKKIGKLFREKKKGV